MMPLPTHISESVRRLNPQLFGIAPVKNHEAIPKRKVSHAVAQSDKAPALDRAVSGEAKSVPRVVVRFTGYRVQPLDPDNFAGSVKDLLDGLRHAQLISGDEPWKIKLETEQVKVGAYRMERTEIEIETP